MMGLWRLVGDMWRARQRKIDMDILWPICCKGANDIDHAKAAFATHAFNDPAWQALGEAEIFRRIDELEPADG